MAQTPFHRTSAFDQAGTNTHRVKPLKRAHAADEKRLVPTPDELERWYRILDDLLNRELDGDTNHTEDLTDLRDEIYAYLR